MSAPTKILVASHKPYWMPSDPLYMPVHVGAALADAPLEGFQPDDAGDSISAENPRYCELTALYWGWKNLEADHLGLAHYRRHFAGSGERGTLTGEEAADLLRRAPVICPKPRNYVIETIEAHYGHTFDPVHIECLRAALEAISPESLPAFEASMSGTRAHMFNMLVMRRDLLDAYCEWLFSVLRLAEAGIDFTGMTPFEQRCMGRLGERLLDTWLAANDVPYVERAVKDMEPVNWVRKGGSFLSAKFAGKKYKESF